MKFLPLVLDKLLVLLVKPPILNNSIFNIGQAVFESIAKIVQKINEVIYIGAHNIIVVKISFYI